MSSRAFAIIAAVWAAVAVGTAAAETVLFDFETEAERAAVPAGTRYGFTVAVTNVMAVSGEHSLLFECPPFRKGVAALPSFTLRPSITNWTGFDRLVIEVTSARDTARGVLTVCIAGPSCWIRRGVENEFRMSVRGHRQWVVPLKGWRETSPANVTRVHLFSIASTHPEGHEYYIDRLTLLKNGEPLPVPNGPGIWRDIQPMVERAKDSLYAENKALRTEIAHAEDYVRFCAASMKSPVASHDMALGMATPMEKIMPRGRFAAKPIPKGGLKVRLARNEREAVQLLVAPMGRDLRGVRVAVDGDLTAMPTSAGKMPASPRAARQDAAPPGGPAAVPAEPSNRQTVKPSNSFAATNVVASVVGYVNAKNEAPYRVGYEAPSDDAPGYRRKTRIPPKGWWPDPILDFLDGVMIAGTDVQSFWIDVRCPEDQPAGEYVGVLVVSADGVESVRIPFSVRVNRFAVPRTSPLPLAITFCPDYAMGTNSPAPRAVITGRLTEWCDFLADHYVTMDDIYVPQNGRNTIHFDMLERLRGQGRLGLFNLGYWALPKSTNETDMAAWRKKWIEPIKEAYEEARRRDLLGHAYCYGCDEVGARSFPLVRAAAEEVRAAAPGVSLSTTSFDDDFGVGTNRLLDVIDWFTPQTMKFDPVKAARSRAEGHQVWWYICMGPQAPFANMFVECPAIEGRILMGAQTVRMRPDGFLYYFINLWPRTNRCIENGPFTDWNPRSYGTTHGDGAWVCPGPGGRPLSTIRFENFRDGLEDYAYAKLLEQKLKELGENCSQMTTNINCSQIANINSNLPTSETPSLPEAEATTPLQPSNRQTVKASNRASWAQRAREALAVPDYVIDGRPYPAAGWDPEYWRNCPLMYSMTNFTDDPAALYRWRDEIADLIEEAAELGR